MNGTTPAINATNLNKLQDNTEDAIQELETNQNAKIKTTTTLSDTDIYSCNYVNSIIESGSNTNGSYVKYADGTMICRHRFYDASDTSTQSGALYVSANVSFPNFPVEFTDTPTVAKKYENATWASGNVFGLLNSGYTTSTNPGSSKLVSSTSSTNNGGYITYIAIGKWK